MLRLDINGRGRKCVVSWPDRCRNGEETSDNRRHGIRLRSTNLQASGTFESQARQWRLEIRSRFAGQVAALNSLHAFPFPTANVEIASNHNPVSCRIDSIIEAVPISAFPWHIRPRNLKNC